MAKTSNLPKKLVFSNEAELTIFKFYRLKEILLEELKVQGKTKKNLLSNTRAFELLVEKVYQIYTSEEMKAYERLKDFQEKALKSKIEMSLTQNVIANRDFWNEVNKITE